MTTWKHPPGTPVIYTEIRGLPSTARLTRTSSPAWSGPGVGSGSGERVRIADGDELGVPVDHLVALPCNAIPELARGPWPIDSYPLTWPRDVAQRTRSQRRTSRYRDEGRAWTADEAWRRLAATAEIFGVRSLVVSTDLQSWIDGDGMRKYARPTTSTDPAVATWLELNGRRYVIAIDAYTLTACNMVATTHVLTALRKIEQQSPDAFERAMRGFMVQREGHAEAGCPRCGGPTEWRGTLVACRRCLDMG